VNLTSAFALVRSALPQLDSGGSIVLVGSVLATATDEDFLTTAYAVSKGGLRSLVRAAAREGAPKGVRVNLVSPALVDTPMATRAIHDDPHIAERIPSLHPLGGTALHAREVANGICWLLSPASAAMTGSDLVLDRGWTL
jgi:NAD(P)-dependent dehydrogenase (short-subunit alcohol dehydrogenase family)